MRIFDSFLMCLIAMSLAGCYASHGGSVSESRPTQIANPKTVSIAPQNTIPVVHVFVALCDNVNQGIVPVSASLGNGDSPVTNLYWGAAFGISTFFRKSKTWEVVAMPPSPQPAIMQRLIFKHKTKHVLLVADAYRGKEIRQATVDFLEAAAGRPAEEISIPSNNGELRFRPGGSAAVVAYIGHNGLMDFNLTATPQKRDEQKRQAIILACASKQYFSTPLKSTGASPLLWTTNLMAPEAYVLSAALDGWINQETDEQIRSRAAKAYHSYQNCGLKAASKLFATGW